MTIREITRDHQYQLLQIFTSIYQAHKESLPEYLPHSQIAHDHLLAALPAKATAEDLLSTILTILSLQNLKDTKENHLLRDTLHPTTKIGEKSLEMAYRKEQTLCTTNTIVAKQESVRKAKVIIAAAAKDDSNNNHRLYGNYPPCPHCLQTLHKPERCWLKFPEKKPE
ncbi:hypothetical protein FRB96_003063 [Tulasnella sp. 330]|nr:hypothetical protein FRB96_003063 [Tulasnella sp. 330]